MTAKEWLEVMKKASDFPKGTEILIEKYGKMLLMEFISWYANKYEMTFTDEFKQELIEEFLTSPKPKV